MDTFNITVIGTYTRDEIPPRCRKPRPVSHETAVIVEIPVVSEAEAPVVLSSKGDAYDVEHAYRGHDGRLYAPYKPYSRQEEPTLAGGEQFPAVVDETNSWRSYASSEEEFAEHNAERYSRYLIIENVDGAREVWRRVSEPRYYVSTGGFGGNHGGTWLSTANHDNPNIAAYCYFRADDFEAAQAFAIEVAKDRGDTLSVPRIEAMEPTITVHDPAYVTLVTPRRESKAVTEARDTLRSAAREYEAVMSHRWSDEARSAADEQDAWRRLAEARQDLALLTDDPTGAEATRRPYEARGEDDL